MISNDQLSALGAVTWNFGNGLELTNLFSWSAYGPQTYRFLDCFKASVKGD